MLISYNLAVILAIITTVAFAKNRVRDCAKPERWAASMAQTHLKNAGLLKNDEINFAKTEVNLLASEKTTKNLYHQIQKVVFIKKDGDKISVITENDASNEECSMGGVKVYLIGKELGP